MTNKINMCTSLWRIDTKENMEGKILRKKENMGKEFEILKRISYELSWWRLNKS